MRELLGFDNFDRRIQYYELILEGDITHFQDGVCPRDSALSIISPEIMMPRSKLK